MNLIAQAVKVEEPPVRNLAVNERWGIDEIMRKGLPTEKRILTDEIYKVLYFNNENPQKYNVAFWADHFQISAAAIRNIVNYIAYPLVD